MQQNSPVDPHEQLRRLTDRVARLEHDRRHDARFRGFAPVYAACGAALVVASFLPLYENSDIDEESGVTLSYGSVWELVSEDSSGASAVGILLILVLVGLLGSASFVRVTEMIVLPVTISVVSVIVAAMVIAKPATENLDPDIASGGHAGIAIVAIAAVVGVVHAWLLVQSRNRRR
ncbi:MAG TPA: hypothetical protein VK059_07760 [Nocardioidaceae bacterium]|nr:hypothetical protein [Nocardioidaceae bacterium]